jgi:transposase
MFTLGLATKIYLATGSTDLRKGINSLYALIERDYPGQSLHGDLYIFCNHRRDTIKIFTFDGTGFWLSAKRLEAGTYQWPSPGTPTVQLTHPELQLLLSGLDLTATKKRKWWRP